MADIVVAVLGVTNEMLVFAVPPVATIDVGHGSQGRGEWAGMSYVYTIPMQTEEKSLTYETYGCCYALAIGAAEPLEARG